MADTTAPISSSVHVDGLAGLRDKLVTLERKTQRKILRDALKAGSEIIRKQAKDNAPVESGFLKSKIRVSGASIRSRKGEVTTAVTTGSRFYVGKAFYAAFQEFGWHHGKRTNRTRAGIARYSKSGKKIGRAAKIVGAEKRRFVEGKHFIERAFDTQKNAAADKIIETLKDGIEQAAQQ